ncbi:hypothetical protein USDA257_p03400 (plasmid) [Sinorhizobium fredii USDA 257]|uniref:Uncharacterized protein n=1 Tax=Sinorhizobium fredii (strain USDA 257) TaxID=1185652 RepID=I3XGP9_SINF2|nr:hypothetical protein USDA257_p03400 [Sinorhizobium fredii USDA 257]
MDASIGLNASQQRFCLQPTFGSQCPHQASVCKLAEYPKSDYISFRRYLEHVEEGAARRSKRGWLER